MRALRPEAAFEDLAEPITTLERWLGQERSGELAEQALVGGLRTDRLGWAFASGYAAAGRRMFDDDALWALCATEAGGAHPRAIQTTLEGRRLNGVKGFVSMGTWAEKLAVVARVGQEDGRPKLVVAVVDPASPGVSLRPGAELPFVPEIPHAALELRQVEPVYLLPGDGYSRVLKPFRTVEDTHVLLGVVGWMLRFARREGQQARVEALLSAALSLAAIAQADPGSSATHLALAGSSTRVRELLAGVEGLDPEEARLFERDRKLLEVAGKARAARRAKAWSALGIVSAVSRQAETRSGSGP